MNRFICLFVAGLCVLSLHAQSYYFVRMADSEMKRSPEAWMLDFSRQPKWNYCHGLVLQSILQVWEKTGETKYYDYAYRFADDMINDQGVIKGYKMRDYNIDRVNSGKILFPLYAASGKEKLRMAADSLRTQMATHPRTADGGFWHKKVYPHQMWLDGLYMASPFLAQYAAVRNEPSLFDDVARQIITVAKHTLDEKTGLYYHAWDESRSQQWADPLTGKSPHFWSRSIGWYMMAIVDVLDFLPESHPDRPEIIRILKDLSLSLENVRDKETGMWYQVTDRIGAEGNYLESTGSIMFIYSWIKAARKGYISPLYLKKGMDAYQKYIDTFVREEQDGTLSITNCCAVAGLGGKPYRSGTYEYYISEPVRDNDPKAVGPFIMTSLLLNR